jgi:hypothetical protein
VHKLESHVMVRRKFKFSCLSLSLVLIAIYVLWSKLLKLSM